MAMPVATLRNAAGLLVLLAASRAALAQTGYAVGANATILKTSDGGANWVAQTSGTTWGMYAVHFPVDATTGYAVGWNGTILKTTDGGTTWTDVQDPTKTVALRSVHFPVDATTGYVVGKNGTIL